MTSPEISRAKAVSRERAGSATAGIGGALGTGTPLVLLHGNGSMIEDFQSSGLIDLAAKKHRVSKSLAEEENADQLLNQVARPLMSAAKMPAPVQ